MPRNKHANEDDRFVPPSSYGSPGFDPNGEHFSDILSPATSTDVNMYDAALVGEPYDGGQTSTRGAAGGLSALRKALAETKTDHPKDGPVSGFADPGGIAIPDRMSINDVHDRPGRRLD